MKQIEALKALNPKRDLNALKPEENLESIKGFFPKNMNTNEIKNEVDEIRIWKEKIEQKDLQHKPNKCLCHIKKFEAIRSFSEVFILVNIIKKAEMNQPNLLEKREKFNNKSKPKTKEGNDKKRNTFDSVNACYEDQDLPFNAYRSGMFPIKAIQGKGRQRTLDSSTSDLPRVARVAKLSDNSNLKMLTPRQMLQRLPITLAQVKAGNTSENLLNEIRRIIYSLYRAKEITKKSI